MDTVVAQGINPIAKAERSLLIMATTLHELPTAHSLLQTSQLNRIKAHTPALFG